VRDAALRLFAQSGYAAVSMRQIASAVGVQAGALYNYTPDKQTLLFDLMQAHMSDLLRAVPEPTGQPAEDLETFVRFHIAWHHARADAVFIAYMELRNLAPDNFARIEALRRSYENHLQAILQRGVGTGVFRMDDAKVATMAVIAMLTGINTWFREDGRLSLADIQNIYWSMVRRAVAAD